MDRRQLGFSRIAPRLRLVLLSIAFLVIAQPLYFYFSSVRINDEQDAIGDRLISTAFQSAILAKEINRIAAGSDQLQMQTDLEDLTALADALNADIDDVAADITSRRQDGATYAVSTRLVDELGRLKDTVSKEAAARAKQIEVEGLLADAIANIRAKSSEMIALLGTEIAEQQIALNALILELGAESSEGQMAATRVLYQNLISLNSIADTVKLVRFFFPASANNISGQMPDAPRARLQLQMRLLATNVAKLREGEVQRAIAKNGLELNGFLFGDNGIFSLVDQYDAANESLSSFLVEKRSATAGLLTTSERYVQTSRDEFALSRSEAAEALQNSRLYIFVIAAIVSVVVIGAIVLVVERQFNRRISILTSRVMAIARGEQDTGDELGGNDELSAMSDALSVFKSNANELRDVNRTLTHRNEDVRQLSARLETILDTTSSGIIAFDESGEIILANRPARHFLGDIHDQAPFERPADVRFLDREDLSRLDASSDPINRAIAGQSLNNEIALMESPGDGDGRYVRISSNVVDKEQSGVRVVVAIDDVSEAEQNRQQIERASRLDALGQLTGGIAHDFNNLLATIQYAVQLVADTETQSERERFSRIALESVERGSQLSNRLLSFARRQPGVSKSHSVEGMIEDFRDLVSPTIESFISLQFSISDPDMSVFCDGGQLENALLNLVLNARDAILRDGTGDKILVNVRGVADLAPQERQPDAEPDRYSTNTFEDELRQQSEQSDGAVYRYVEFSVSDNGPGMTEEVKRRALDPFFTTKSVNTGTGLGLSMVYGFVQQSGGELRIYSDLGSGTTIRLILPRGSLENRREEPIDGEMPKIGSGENILVVEDEPHLLEAMHALIERLGYTMHTATSGRAALEFLKTDVEIDLLLTDIVMPGGIGGFDLAAQVRAMKPDIPILYMSGYAAYSEAEMGGVVAPLIQKPCAPKDLAEKLSVALA